MSPVAIGSDHAGFSLKAENIAAEEALICVIGDRASDVLTALNINGFGVLIPFGNEPANVGQAIWYDYAILELLAR
jgi:phosphoglycolate phosphatase-like HAD superfamily hydrolase